MRSILQIIRILAARYPHRFFYAVIGFILATILMAFGFWKTLAIVAITALFYFIGILSERGINLREFIKRLFER